MHEDGARETVDLRAPGKRVAPGEPAELPEPQAVTPELADHPATTETGVRPPGTSPLDGYLPPARGDR